MLDQQKAAQYLVVAWCKDWSMQMLLATLNEFRAGQEWPKDYDGLIDSTCAEYDWLPKWHIAFRKGYKVRQFVGGCYPKLSSWLYDRATDIDRLKCSAQVERLKCPEKPVALRSVDEATEQAKARREYRQATTSYRTSRDSYKTHQRSAWNVCKA